MRNKKNLILDNPDMKPKGINMRLVGENWSTVSTFSKAHPE
ncbi:MAG: hypothetical protein CM1200mP2_12050 [Planctomycetaceae bacterium]|nr:MAG: hypothetical protein CM1200mP2_12050 [Planctomycetaceae bacterium]